jgi:hypothetical protein
MMDIGTTLRRVLRSWVLYAGRRESVRGALLGFREQLAMAGDGGRVVFRFTPGAILVGDEAADDDDDAADAVVFVAFRDGLRALAIEPTIPEDELATLVGILASGNERQRNRSEDVVAQLWAARLPHVAVSAVDPYANVELADEVADADDERLATDLMPHVRGAGDDPGDPGVEGAGFRSLGADDAPPPATVGATRSGAAVEPLLQTVSDVVSQQVLAWRAPPASVPPPRVVGAPAMRFPRRAVPVDWTAIARAREGARVALAIERIVACHAATVAEMDALLQVTLDAWRHPDGRALAALVAAIPTLPDASLERWRSTINLNGAYTTGVQEGLAAQAESAPRAVAEWFRVAGVNHVENVGRACFAGRARSTVEAWLRAAPECALLALQHWVGLDADDAVWATRCATSLPPGEARAALLRRVLAHRDLDVQFMALEALPGDVSPETNGALERCLASGRRDRMQHVLRELGRRSDGDSARVLLAYVESAAYGDVPAVQRAAVLDMLLAKGAPAVVEWVRERTAGWGWRLSLRGRERNAEIAAALQRLSPELRRVYP